VVQGAAALPSSGPRWDQPPPTMAAGARGMARSPLAWPVTVKVDGDDVCHADVEYLSWVPWTEL
jgi:hypothetical protein